MDWLTNPDVWISLATLTALEVVLGIDNLIFISILSGKLPPAQQGRARKLGLALALVTRILLLAGLAWVVKMDKPFIERTLALAGHEVKLAISGKDLVLIVGGLFLLWKSVREIHHKLEGEDGEKSAAVAPTFASVIIQILLIDIVFSLDSVITAVGMVKMLGVMIAAVIIAMIVMLVFVNQISGFVERHPTVKMLALAFLVLIGTMLVAEGFHQHVNKGYIYFAMVFAMAVEFLNLRSRRKSEAVTLHQEYR
jgi:predicted tellurium resistance membrane protein TerC